MGIVAPGLGCRGLVEKAGGEGMGHFLAPHLAPALVAAILAHCRAAEGA